ncbi:MAG: hypothetical protein ACJ8D5_07220 [Sphingomicrobium sp.]
MYKAYFARRLLEAISSARQAGTEQERAIHLRVSRYYHDLIRLRSPPAAEADNDES